MLVGMRGNAQEFPVIPYVDPSQLAVPWGWHSFYKQPWRAYMETRSGYSFLQGIGVNYNAPSNDELAIRTLTAAGVKAVRYQIGWGSVNWNETALLQDSKIRNTLTLFKKYGLRPTILLNAHHGFPCPLKSFSRVLITNAPLNSKTVTLDDVNGIVPKYTGLSNLTGYKAAEVFITSVNATTHMCKLSHPLPVSLFAGNSVSLATLKYRPLFPVGNLNYVKTIDGWKKYALLICSTAKSCGIQNFDLEIWNELSFGSNFLNINNYYQPPAVNFPQTDYLLSGGHLWEMAAHTISAVKAKYPAVNLIWGFSNSSFFHTPADKLPTSTSGKSYHPYGVGTRSMPAQEQNPPMNLEGYTPGMDIRMPEGWANSFQQTESLIRLINPVDRIRHPDGTVRLLHYMTEHGVYPPECGVNNPQNAWDLKAKVAVRAYPFWLNKGIDMLGYYDAYDPNEVGFGLLPPAMVTMASNTPFDQIATPPLKAMQNLTKTFADSVVIANPVQLSVNVTAVDTQSAVFPGDNTHPPLWERDMLTLLPFHVSAHKFIIAAYTMTFDINALAQEASYRLVVGGCQHTPIDAKLYDPLTVSTLPLQIISTNSDGLIVQLSVTNTPRLLIITL